MRWRRQTAPIRAVSHDKADVRFFAFYDCFTPETCRKLRWAFTTAFDPDCVKTLLS
jgi:hypothetical protein